jgi:WD40 repeat protein
MLAVSPGGDRIATTGPDDRVLIWDLATGRCVSRILAPHAHREALALSPDGKILYVADYAGVAVYDVASEKPSGKRFGNKLHVMGITGIALSKDGRMLVSGNTDPEQSALRIWDTTTGKELPAPSFIPSQNGFVLSLSEDGKRLAASDGGKIRVWELPSGKETVTLMAHPENVHYLGFSHRGALLASTGDDKTIRLWSATDGKRIHELKGQFGLVSSLTFSPDDALFATCGTEDPIELYDTATGTSIRQIDDSAAHCTTVRYSPDGNTLIGGGYTGTIGLWNARTGKRLDDLPGHHGPVMGLLSSPDGRTLASIGRFEYEIRLWDVRSRRELHRLADRVCPTAIAYSQDGTILASAGERKIVFWDPIGGREVRRFEATDEQFKAYSLALSPDGKKVITGGIHSVVLWNVDTGVVRSLVDLKDQLLSEMVIRYSPDGKLFIAGPIGTEIRTWDTSSYEQQPPFDAMSGIIEGPRTGKRPPFCARGVIFSPDSSLLVAGGPQGTIRLWDSGSRKELAGFVPTRSTILSMAISPDGSVIASGDEEGIVRLWEARSGAEIRSFRGHEGDVNALTFVSAGSILASGGRDTTILLWRVFPEPEAGKQVNSNHVWTDLAAKDGPTAYRAMEECVHSGNQGVEYLKDMVHSVPSAVLRKLIERLDDEQLTLREEAMAELSRVGGEAQALLESSLSTVAVGERKERVRLLLASLTPPLIKSPGRLRILRAITILEWIGTPEAERALQEIAIERSGTFEGTSAERARGRLLHRKP